MCVYWWTKQSDTLLVFHRNDRSIIYLPRLLVHLKKNLRKINSNF